MSPWEQALLANDPRAVEAMHRLFVDMRNLWVRPHEVRVLQAVADGRTAFEASVELGLSYSTVRTYIKTARERLGASNTTHAVALAFRQGLIS